MKILLKIIAAWFALFLLFVISVYIFLVWKGTPFIANRLKALTHKNVTIGHLGITPTLKFEFKDVNIEGAFKARSVIVAPSFLLFITGNIGFNEIKAIDPEFTYEKFAAAAPQAAADNGTAAVPAVIPERPKERKPLPFVFKQISVTGGKFIFIDHTVGAEGIRLVVEDISLRIGNLPLVSRPMITPFALKGVIPWQAGEAKGKIAAEGWLDLYKKDMHASLKIIGIDGVYLSPYYSQWVDVQKTGIEKAKLDFTSNINGLDDDVAAECHFELRDIIFHQPSGDGQEEKGRKIAKAVFKFFQSLDNGKIELNFTYRTKMSRPQLGMGTVVGAVENKFNSGIKEKKRPIIGDVFVLPVRLLEGAVRASTDLSKAVIDGTVAVGKELKNATQASFTREK